VDAAITFPVCRFSLPRQRRQFTGDVLRKLLGGVRNALAFPVHHQFDRRQRRKAVLLAEAADVGSDGAARKHRDGKTGEYRCLKSCDAVAAQTRNKKSRE